MARATAHEIFRSVEHAAQAELERSMVGLAFSGLSAGLNISFSFVALAATLRAAQDSALLVGAAVYPLGFILIILARAQLFTENTLTPVLLVLHRPTRANIVRTAQLWAVVLAANLLGAFLFALALAHLNIAPHVKTAWLDRAAAAAFAGTWGSLFLRAIFGGWLIALLTWMLHAGGGPVAEVILVWIAAFTIQLCGFSHSIAGATEVLYLANRGLISYVDWALGFQVPVTLGNMVGGVVFVALVNYAQVVGTGADVAVAEFMEDIENIEAAERVRVLPPETRGAPRGGGSRPADGGSGTRARS